MGKGRVKAGITMRAVCDCSLVADHEHPQVWAGGYLGPLQGGVAVWLVRAATTMSAVFNRPLSALVRSTRRGGLVVTWVFYRGPL